MFIIRLLLLMRNFMKKLLAFFFALIIFNISFYAQQLAYIRPYFPPGDANLFSVKKTADGGYIMIGNTDTYGSGNGDVFIIKTDMNGDTLWTRVIGGAGNDDGFGCEEIQGNGFIINGATNSFGAGRDDFYLIRLDSNGDTLFTRAFGDTTEDSPSFYSTFQRLTNGNFILSGFSTIYQTPSASKMYLMMTDSSGNLIWSKRYVGPGITSARSVKVTNNSNLVVLGIHKADTLPATAVLPLLMKVDTSGNVLWAHTYSGLNTFQLYAASKSNDGGFILSGYTGAFNANNHQDFILIKTDSLGQLEWSKVYGNALNSSFMGSAIQTSDGGYIVCGASREEYGFYPQKCFLLKTNAVGDTLWTRWFGNYDELKSIEETPDLGFITVGQYGSLVKTDSLGHTTCNEFPHNPLYTITTALITTPVTLQVSSWGQQSMTQSVVMSAPINVTTICSNVGIETTSSPESFSLYPNPATNELTIEIDGIETKNATIRIISMLGQTVFEKTEQANNGVLKDLLDVSQLSEGIYFVEVIAGEKRLVKKMVVQ